MFFYFLQYNNLFLINTLLVSFFSLSILFSQTPENDIVLDEVLLSSKMLYTKKEYFFYKKKVLKVYHYVDTLRNVITELANELQAKIRASHGTNHFQSFSMPSIKRSLYLQVLQIRRLKYEQVTN